nr:ATP-binding protein [Alishewanella maricola]
MSLEDAFDFVTYGFGHNLLEDNKDASSLLKDVLLQGAAPTLQLTHYPHLKTDLQILLPYLKSAIKHKLVGVNVLIYGPPGTGKSELVRVLAQKLKLPLYEVSSEDEDGDAISGFNRLRAYRMAQKFLEKSANLLLFDETEDVFEHNPFSRSAEPRKAWMNRMLENNLVPSFWITNNQRVIDDAFIRRFDQVIKLDVPPKAQRAALLQSAAPALLTQAEAEKLAEHPALTPAIITRAGRVIASLNPRLNRADKVASLQHLMQQTLRAQGFTVDYAKERDVLGAVYDASLTNADVDLAGLTAGLIRAGSGRLCLYGPSGTGKTAFCHYLAKQLQKPLIVKTAGQLFGMFVGETEKRIAAAFAEAKENEAVLLLDEVDSFLQDRRKAQQSWEVTAVNEMLMQMEAFEGVFVASTNLLHNLDQASLRRFDLKAGFHYLKPAQALSLFKAHCQQLKLTPCKSSEHRVTSALRLTPGDFAALARQSRFRPFSTASDFVSSLLLEVSLKSDDIAKPMGFLQ